MGVKKVPGGYRLVPRRPGAMFRKKKGSVLRDYQAYETMMSEGGGPESGGAVEGAGGSDPIAMGMPGGGFDAASPEAGSSPSLEHGSLGVGEALLSHDSAEKDKDTKSDKDAAAKASADAAPISKGKATLATVVTSKGLARSRAAARRPPPRPPVRGGGK